jgi:hypothetical protein
MIDLRIARGHDAAHKPTLSGYAELRQFPATGNGGTRPDMRAYDPEPEYIAIDHRGDKAYVGPSGSQWRRRAEPADAPF